MPKKTETGHHYIKAVTDAIKNAGSTRELYLAIHGVEPSRQELQRFINRLNPSRCNPGADMLGLCVEHLPSLHNMTLKTFFAIEGPETEQDKKELTMTGTTSPEQSLLDLAQFEAMAYSRQHQQAFSAAVHILDSLNNTYAKIDQVARQTLSFRARKDSADGETVLV